MIAVTPLAEPGVPTHFCESTKGVKAYGIMNYDKLGPVPAYQQAWLDHQDEDVIVFMHSDVTIHEPWADRVMAEFGDPKVAIVGLGGALGIGTPDIYKRPYDIWQLARQAYFSNQSEWHVHGQRETGSRDVAVVEGFFMAIRGELLRQIGGWSWYPFEFHTYDTCMCLMAHRHGWKIRMVGISVRHHGGGASITPGYIERCRKHGTTPEREHQEPHAWMYNEFRDCLPVRVR